MSKDESRTLEVITGGALESLTKGEIESQIDIAKRYPRSIDRFLKSAIDIACVDEETAASCLYHRPVGKGEDGKQVFADGLSIRMAEIVGASYQNLRVYSLLIDQTDRQVVARGMAIDLENNFASSSEVVEATVDRNGRPYSERMRAVVAKAALAKARRDATFQVVPRALAKPVETAVRKLLVGDAKSMDTRRRGASDWIKSLNIEPKRVWNTLGISGAADLGADELAILAGIRTAIMEKDTTIDEAFPDSPLKRPAAANKADSPPDSKASESPEKPTEPPKQEPPAQPTAPRAGRKATNEKAGPTEVEKTQDDIINDCLLWIENATDEEILDDKPWVLEEIRKVQGTANQVKVLKPFNVRRKELAAPKD